jgi:hypothetical protein
LEAIQHGAKIEKCRKWLAIKAKTVQHFVPMQLMRKY